MELDKLFYTLELHTEKFDTQITTVRQRLRTIEEAAPKPITVAADTRQATEQLDRLHLGAVAATVALLAIGTSAIRIADEVQQATGRLRLAVSSTDDLASAQARLGEVADDTFASYGATVDMYARLAMATKALNRSQADLLASTEATNLAIRLSGASSKAATAGLIQFGWAIASGRLGGDELRSVLEKLPRLASAIADGLGVSVGELRTLGEQGALSAERVLDALLTQVPKLRAEAATIGPTLGQSLTVFQNALARYVDGTNTVTGATATLATVIAGAATNFEKIATVATVAGAIYAGRVVPPILKAAQDLAASQVAQVRDSQRAVQARVDEAAAALEQARAAQAATAAKLRDIEATREAIVLTRQLTLAERERASKVVARAVPAAQLAPLGGAVVAREAATQAAAQATLARTTTELAQLGQQQTRAQRELQAATAAAAVAEGVATTASRAHATAIAGTTVAARAGAIAVKGFQGAIALLGGPIGAAITAALVGISIAIDRQRKNSDAARDAVARYTEALNAMSEAQIRARLGQLEGERIGVIVQRQQLAPGDNEGQVRLSRQEQIIAEGMGRLRERFAAMNRETAKAADAVGSDFARQIGTAEAQLRVLNTEGERAARVFGKAAEAWKDSTTQNRSFEEALAQNDQRAKARLADADRLLRAEEALSAGMKGQASSAKEAAAELARVRDAARELSTEFADLTPQQQATAQIAEWAENAERAKLPTEEIAATVQRLNAAFRAAADAKSATAVAASLRELTEDLAALQAEASGNALAVLDVTFAKITSELEKKADASRDAATAAAELGDSESAEKLRRLSAGYREQVQVAERRRDGLKDLARLSERVAAAQEIEARFTKAANAAYGESVPTLADVKRAENELLSVRTVLQELANDPKTDPAVRAEAQKLLATLVKEEARATGEVATATSTAATNAMKLGAGIQSSAQAALSLVQLLGEGNSELAQMLSSVVSIGSGIGGLGSAAQQAGGFGALFSSGAGIASALGPIGAIAGGVVSLVSTFGKQSAAAKARAAELEKAATTFSDNLAKFVRDIAETDLGTFTQQRNALAEQIGSLVRDAAAKAGFDASGFSQNRSDSRAIAAYIARLQAQLEAIYAAADPETGTFDGKAADDILRFIAALEEVGASAREAEAQLQGRQAAELKRATDDVRVRTLLVQGRSAEAEALREQLAAQQALDQAMNDFLGAEGYLAYIEALQELQRQELAAAAATRARASAIALLNDTNDVLGGTAQEKLSRSLTTFGTLFDNLAGVATGLDLGSRGGLSALQERLRSLFNYLAVGGLTDAEQPIVDAIKALLGNIEDALDVVDAPFTEAVNAFGQMVETFGLSLAEQATGYARLYGEQFEDFAALLGEGFDVATLDSAGLASLKQRIGEAISAILADGTITDAEAPYLQALQQFFGIIGGMITAATDDAEAASQRAQETRGRNASLDVALGDLAGADAFRASLGRYSEAFRELFSAVDLSTSDGIAAAGDRLRTIRTQLESLTDAEVVARFGMTRDEVLDAILDVDGGLDQLGDGLRDLAAQQGDFLNDLNLQYLDATGQGLEAVTLQTEIWAAQMLATAEALGLATDEIRTKIQTIASSKIAAAVTRMQEEAARATPASPDAAMAATESGALSRWGSITTTDALSLNTVLTSMLVELREVSRYAARMAGALDLLVAGSGIPALMVPSLPAGVGFAATGGPSISIIINVNGPIAGMSPTEAGQRIGETLVQELNQALGRAAGIDRRLRGVVS